MKARLLGSVGIVATLAVLAGPVLEGTRVAADAPPLTPWYTDGNSGTTPGTDFLGTTDNKALELKVNNERALRIEPDFASPTWLGGFAGNTVTTGATGAVIAGGGTYNFINSVTDIYGFVGGGIGNQAGDGASHTSSARYATVGGGKENRAGGELSVVGGGEDNYALDAYTVITGGISNTASMDYDAVVGGFNNVASGSRSFVGGGAANKATGFSATIVGGNGNTASGNSAAILGGGNNAASGAYSTIGGGVANQATETGATVGGGYYHRALASYTTIGGGGSTDTTNQTTRGATSNWVTDDFGTIGGGANNKAGDNAGTISDRPYITIGGGQSNQASGGWASIAGGLTNSAAGGYGAVGGGRQNTASGGSSTIAGGTSNTTSGFYSAITGGRGNTASGTYSLVGGGANNVASGANATVPGGVLNTAAGGTSFAAGYRAKANHTGSFVWGDTTAADIASTDANQFIVRAKGLWFGTTSTPSIPAGQFLSTSTGAYLSSGGTWTNSSDRNAKTNIVAVDSASILEKVAAMPLAMWNYKSQDATVKHIGPMAQDFSAAFGLGEDDTHIATVDADGVALAAIQGLNAKVDEKDATIAALQARVTELERNAGVTSATVVTPTAAAPSTMTMLALALGVVNALLLLGGAGMWMRGRAQRS